MKPKRGPKLPGDFFKKYQGNRGEDGEEGKAPFSAGSGKHPLPKGVSMFHVTNRREKRKLERQQKKLKRAPQGSLTPKLQRKLNQGNPNPPPIVPPKQKKGAAQPPPAKKQKVAEKPEAKKEAPSKKKRKEAEPESESEEEPELDFEEDEEGEEMEVDDSPPAAKKGKKKTDDVFRPARVDDQGRFIPAVSRELFEEDLKLERRMEKLLGISKKSGKKIGGPSDGLEGLLEGIDAADADAWPLDPGAGKKGKKAAAEGGAELDDQAYLEQKRLKRKKMEEESEEEEDGSDFDEDEDEDEDEDGLESDEDEEDGSDFESGSDEEEDEDGEDESEEEGEKDGDDEISKLKEMAASGRYLPPALRKKLDAALQKEKEAAQTAAQAGNKRAIEDLTQDVDVDPAVARRVRGLLNRLAEPNLQGIVGDLMGMYQEHGRRAVTRLVAQELLSASAEGPRATEQFAAVSAACVAGFCALSGSQELAAIFLSALAEKFVSSRKDGETITTRNLCMLLAYLYSSGIIAASLVYSFLAFLQEELHEDDVSCIVTVLNSCGLSLRADDPVAMKDFVVAVHKRAGELKGGVLTKRAELMLELVCDIKNNKRKEGASGGKTAALSPAVMKWLKGSCRVEESTLRSLTWKKLLLPASEKKGLWWQPRAGELLEGDIGVGQVGGAGGEGAASKATTAVLKELEEREGGISQQELLALAAKMRMNTDNRRAIFCIIMGSDDFVDCAEKLLRFPVKGEQEREIVRVLMECCLQEASYNPYYHHVAARIAAVSRSHRMTLQFAVWDHLKRIKEEDASGEGVDPRRAANLARFLGALLASFSLPISALKVADIQTAGPTEIAFWRIALFDAIQGAKSIEDVGKMFERLQGHAQLNGLRSALRLFIRTKLGPWVAEKKNAKPDTLQRVRLAEKMLNTQGGTVGVGMD